MPRKTPQPEPRRTARDTAEPARTTRRRGGTLNDERREELRALIQRWAPALKELEKH